MGTIIRAISINRLKKQTGIISLITVSAKECLSNSKLKFEQIGILINSGVYTENNLKEPALSTLIQRQLEDNSNLNSSETDRKIYSFDVHNGGGGIINSFQIIDGFIQSGEIEHGLIVTGDVKPKGGIVTNFNYISASASVLLSKCNKKSGFVKFKIETFPEFRKLKQSTIQWDSGGFRVEIIQSKNYAEIAVECTKNTIESFFLEENLSWDDIDIVCTSQSPYGFSKQLQEKLKVKQKIIHLQIEQEIYSSGLLFSLNEFYNNSSFIGGRNILFVTIGAGITVSLAYYKS